mmetsp:Transcript_17327/g.52119  ORF Transcript_17327/g.52119 Transcript_17327/m.52119 type:complete len:230 (+) Transcript_17327:987-1676(+)
MSLTSLASSFLRLASSSALFRRLASSWRSNSTCANHAFLRSSSISAPALASASACFRSSSAFIRACSSSPSCGAAAPEVSASFAFLFFVAVFAPVAAFLAVGLRRFLPRLCGPVSVTFFAAGDFNGGALSAGTLAVASSDGDVAPALASAALTSDAFSAFGEPDLAAALTLCEAFLGEPDALGGDMPLCTAPENSPKRDAIIKDGTVPAGRGSGAVCQGGRWGGGPMLR